MDRGVQATGTDPINPAFNANSVQPSYGGQMGYTRTVSPTMVNQLLLSASYYSAIFGPPDFAAAVKTFPTVFLFADSPFNNLGGTDQSYPSGRKVRQWQLIDDYSIIKGSHNFKFGTNIRKNFVTTFATLPNTTGNFIFNSTTDFVNGSLGNGSTFAQAFPTVGGEPLKMYSAGFYAQDEWKVRRNLTVTLALRFDRNSNITCAGDCFTETLKAWADMNHAAATPYNQTIHTGLTSAFTDIDPIVIEPRIGVAYSVAKSTVLRGGFGIFPDLYPGTIADRFITNSPTVASFTTSKGLVALNTPGSAFANNANSAAAFQSGFSNGATLAQLTSAVPGFVVPNYNTISGTLHNPKFYEWNFEVQQAIGAKYMLSVNYVGNKGVDEFNQTAHANAYTKAGTTINGVPTAAVDPRFGEIRELNNQGWSNYNGLVSSFKWKLGSQFSGSFSYTWSHALDTCSNDCLLPFNNLAAAPSLRYQVSPYGLGVTNYSAADYDVRHSYNANYVLHGSQVVLLQFDSPERSG